MLIIVRLVVLVLIEYLGKFEMFSILKDFFPSVKTSFSCFCVLFFLDEPYLKNRIVKFYY